jgi:hypothetical protein
VITVGSVSRDELAETFPFLLPRFRGRRNAIKALTHARPDFVFRIYPDGRLDDARDAHARNVPRGYEHILDDEPDCRTAAGLGRVSWIKVRGGRAWRVAR